MATVGGDIELMPVADAAVWAASRRLTGTLTVRRRGIETHFTLREGMCVQASSSDPREYLGQHLINFNHIDEDQLQRAFDTQKETRVPLGRVLVMVDAISTEQLQRVLTFKTREGLLEVLCWTEGQWRLSLDIDADPELDCERPIDLRDVTSEAAARAQMWGEIRRVFPSDATRVEVLLDPALIDGPFDRRLLELMSTGRSVGEAALELRSMDFQTYARLYDLASRGLVKPLLTSTTVRPEQLTPQALASSGASIVAGPRGVSMVVPRAATPAQAFPNPIVTAFAVPAPVAIPTTTATTPPPSAAPLSPFAVPAAFVVPEPEAPEAPAVAFPSTIGVFPRPTQIPAPAPVPVVAAMATPAPVLAVEFPGPMPAPLPAVVVPPTAPSIAQTPAIDIDIDIDVDAEPEPFVVPPTPAPAPPASPSRMVPKPSTPVGSYFGAGTYMMVKPERAHDAPGVKIPPDAEDPAQALRLALAGRNWSEAMLLSQRILEHDPIDTEAIAGFRVAEAQLRRLEKEGVGADADFGRVPSLAMARDEVALAHLTSKERYVLSRVDGRRSLEQIAAVSPIQRVELLRIVDSFVQRGVLRY
jgi:hypothetical protein